MRYTIAHRTRYHYPMPVHESHTICHLQPRSDISQYCTRYELSVSPRTRVFSYADRFGNDVQHFAILPEHGALEIVARSQVVTARGDGAAPPPLPRELIDDDPNRDDMWDYLHESRYVRFSAELDALATHVGVPKHGDDAVAWFQHASSTLHDEFEYDTTTTTVHATVEESVRMRSGVCQDFAHVLIALCRRAGIPARYISGYIHSGSGEMLGAEASHAWAEAYLGPRGWVGIDPTNDTWIGDQFVRVATGRDYRDVSPVRGVYSGASSSVMSVDVAVEALSYEQQQQQQ
ncbi:transglutaminase [Vulcanimicrobium alpinum]|uniref:Transglutaminase n=1 Tax=Vulcanimicrobium alpinum TaxID=3016050 RepID=A0AAN1Y067_UNVUL|nr:transglutaminase family protein [Vulcanimicrobium alpinum]BDE07537.1 transglutaminase [Vulcanimicrobium alpinum]